MDEIDNAYLDIDETHMYMAAQRQYVNQATAAEASSYLTLTETNVPIGDKQRTYVNVEQRTYVNVEDEYETVM